MTRVTGPIPKLSNAFRSISTTASASRPSSLLASTTRQSTYLPSRLSDLKHECQIRKLDTAGSKSDLINRLTAYEQTRSHITTGGYRPSPSSAAPAHVFRPLMQGFRTSAPRPAVGDTSTIDYFFFPEMDVESSSNEHLRVPLLPDNYTPDRTQYPAEALDEAVPHPEIHIIAAHPENVVPAALTEVVDNAGIEADVGALTSLFNGESTQAASKEPGVVKEVLGGMWADMFGGKTHSLA